MVVYLFFWFMNALIGRGGNFVGGIFIFFTWLMMLYPFATLFGVLIISSQYGTESQVSSSADYAMTLDNDPNFTLAFNTTALISIIYFVYMFMALPNLRLERKERQAENLAAKEEAEKAALGELFDSNCPLGMKEIDNLCHYPESYDWDWDF